MFAAYNYVITCVLLAEASFCAYQLQLPVSQPITQNDVAYEILRDPISMWPLGAGGRIDSDGYSFSFATHYRFITKLRPFPGANMAEENELLSHDKSMVDTNGAYLLASNWLEAIQVDVRELERTNHPEVQQRWYYGNPGKVFLPVFEVRWGKWDDAKIDVSVDGRTKEMVYIRQMDFSFSGNPADFEKTLSSFSRRPAELIKNLDKLLEIPDEEFNRYSDSERSNLVARFSVVDYSHPYDMTFSISNRYAVSNDYRAIFLKFTEAGKHISRMKESESAKNTTNSP